MYISSLIIKGFRSFGERCEIPLNKGLTVLIGENGSGKSAIIDSIRLLLQEDEYGRLNALSKSDFWRPSTKGKDIVATDKFSVDCEFSGLSQIEQITYLPWLNAHTPTKASLHLEVTNSNSARKRLKRDIWAGDSRASIFEWDTYNTIECNYLPPLRDAEERLRAIRGSRLSRLLTKLEPKVSREHDQEGNKITLEKKVKDQNDELLKDPLIQLANERIRQRLLDALGDVLGQDVLILFTESRFEKILENLRILFFPRYPSQGTTTPTDLFRELSENSLGYNNLIYLATVLAELEESEEEDDSLRILLIEEPEAHLHPQLQTRVMQYIQTQANKANIQIIVTTHSPTIAAAVSLDSLVVVTRPDIDACPKVIPLSKCGLEPHQKFFLERWLDVTKSTLLFARGIIFVEGIAEALVVPELAKRVLSEHFNSKDPKSTKKCYSLEEFAVSVINLGGIYFESFFQLFRGASDNDPATAGIPVRCAGITDCDPKADEAPYEGNNCECKNHALGLIVDLQENKYCQLFYNTKTFEYDLAMESNHNLKLMCGIFLEILTTDGPIRDEITAIMNDPDMKTAREKAEDAATLLKRIDGVGKGIFAQKLALRLADPKTTFSVPDYIKRAVLWACSI
ncbi:ATP-dependent nuclease [Paenibacillus protaetiae]|uniref:DUF2813 domain-containing protein n=1 Tax=Paenibacillus protaetiae TaxID=2509456 RepID=A0A4P6F0D7_9BACL|nr:AAA family ATPase [Paenibacillus protaetiae]QAY68515.1 DUF2813 domain-containing protein [Paenibacillus protaetiae]